MTELKKISIHRALVELKTLESRISKATNEAVIVIANRKSNDKIDGISIDDYKKQMQASHDKVVSLIAYRNSIKAAIVKSNAATLVTVAGKDMTVAEAIERKESISYEDALLYKMQQQARGAINKVASENDALPQKLEVYLVNILGSKDKQNPDEVKLHTETFMKRNEFELVDPLGATKLIESLYEGISEFKTEVDAVLSESNATTFIEIQE